MSASVNDTPSLRRSEEAMLKQLRRFWGVTLKYKWYSIAFFILVVAAGSVYTLRQDKMYRAQATVEIELQTPEILSEVRDIYQLGTKFRSMEYLETQYAILQSRRVCQRVVEKLGLDHDLKFLKVDDVRDPEILEELLKRIDPIRILQENVTINANTNSYLATIEVLDRDPALAALIANTIAETYIEQNLQRKLESTNSALEWLTKQAGDLEVELKTAEEKLNVFKRDHDILSTTMEDRISITSQNLGQINSALVNARGRRMELESKWRQIQNIDPEKEFATVAGPSFIDNSLLQGLTRDYFELTTQEVEMLERFTPEHPKVKTIQDKMRVTRENLVKEVTRTKLSVKIEYETAIESENKMNDEMEKEKRKALDLHDKEVEYNALVRTRDTARRLYELVTQRLKETDVTRMFNTNNISLVDSAIVDPRPVRPRVKVSIAASILLGLIGALLLAYLIDLFDNTIKSEDEVEELLGIPLLGVLPTIRLNTPDLREQDPALLAHHNPKSTIAESVRSLRTNIHFMSPDKELTTLLVTSASPKEGKTTVSTSLCISLAQTGKRVLLVDTDLRNPRLHKIFKISHKIGVTSVVMGDVTLDDAVFHTPVPLLDFLPAGQSTPTPAEMIGSERFAQFVDMLKSRYDYLLFDSPPVGPVADALVLSNLVQGVILVAKFSQTTRDRLQFAKRSLDDVKAPLLGCVINDLDVTNKDYGYYYYRYYSRYGYQYGYGSAYGAENDVHGSEKSAHDDRRVGEDDGAPSSGKG